MVAWEVRRRDGLLEIARPQNGWWRWPPSGSTVQHITFDRAHNTVSRDGKVIRPLSHMQGVEVLANAWNSEGADRVAFTRPSSGPPAERGPRHAGLSPLR